MESKTHKERLLSDASLVQGGAEIKTNDNGSPRIVPTPDQVDTAREEMDAEFSKSKIGEMKERVTKLMAEGDFEGASNLLQEIKKIPSRGDQRSGSEEVSVEVTDEEQKKAVVEKIQKAFEKGEVKIEGGGEEVAPSEKNILSGEFYNDEQVREYLDPSKPTDYRIEVQEAVKKGDLSYASYLVKEFENRKAAMNAKITALLGLGTTLTGGLVGMSVTTAGSSAAITFGAASLLGGFTIVLAGGGYYLYKKYKNINADKKRTGKV